jgi:kynurenine 3-monooxygenase
MFTISADAVGGDLIIPMSGRLMHDIHGNITKQPYGTGDQAIYSISRTGLNKLLLDAVSQR